MDDEDDATEDGAKDEETAALDDGAMLDDDATTEEDKGAAEDETATLDNGGVPVVLALPTALDLGITITEELCKITAVDDAVPVMLDMTLALDVTAKEESPSLAIVPESFAQFKMNTVFANRPKYRPNLDFIVLAFLFGYCEVRARSV